MEYVEFSFCLGQVSQHVSAFTGGGKLFVIIRIAVLQLTTVKFDEGKEWQGEMMRFRCKVYAIAYTSNDT